MGKHKNIPAKAGHKVRVDLRFADVNSYLQAQQVANLLGYSIDQFASVAVNNELPRAEQAILKAWQENQRKLMKAKNAADKLAKEASVATEGASNEGDEVQSAGAVQDGGTSEVSGDALANQAESSPVSDNPV